MYTWYEKYTIFTQNSTGPLTPAFSGAALPRPLQALVRLLWLHIFANRKKLSNKLE